MRAIALSAVGGPDVLSVTDVDATEPGPGQVRIAVTAAAVNPTDTLLRSSAAMTPDSPPPWIPGMDAAGTVESVGAGVDLEVGARVAAGVNPRRPQGGAYVQLLTVPAASVVRVPDGVELVAASTLPMNGLTARFAIDALELPPGGTLAVTGAAGALGAYVVALAAHEGYRVVADAKDSDVDLVRSFGADTVLERGAGFPAAVREAVPGGVDGLVDAAVLDASVAPAVKDGGAVATVRMFDNGGQPGERGVRFLPVSVGDHLEDTAALEQLVARVVDGTIVLRVARTFPAEDAADAHRLLEAGGVRGRPVLLF